MVASNSRATLPEKEPGNTHNDFAVAIIKIVGHIPENILFQKQSRKPFASTFDVVATHAHGVVTKI